VLARRSLTLLVFVVSLMLTGVLYVFVPKGFTSNDDTGMLIGSTEPRRIFLLTAMAAKQQQAIRQIASDPHVATVIGFIAWSGQIPA